MRPGDNLDLRQIAQAPSTSNGLRTKRQTWEEAPGRSRLETRIDYKAKGEMLHDQL
jgi:hypothetical protein